MPLELVHGEVLESRPTHTTKAGCAPPPGNPGAQLRRSARADVLFSIAPVASESGILIGRTPREKDMEQTTRLAKKQWKK
jgi:hypothetical protein